MYNSRMTAKQLLGGGVRPPPEAEPLMRVLNSRVFAGVASQAGDSMYNDIPIYDDSHDSASWAGSHNTPTSPSDYNSKPQRTSTWSDDIYDRQPSTAPPNRSFSTRANPSETFDNISARRQTVGADDYSYSDRKPSRPTAPKPQFKPKPTPGKDQAVALFTFDAAQPGDLGFRKGDMITIVKRTENATDWWTGRIGDREGIFPR